MKYLVIALTLLPAHASASCHHYSIWHFAFPQSCGVAQLRGGDARAAPDTNNHSGPELRAVAPGAIAVTGGAIPDIIVPVLPLTREQAATIPEDEQRQMALEALRPLLDKLVNEENRE